MPAEHIARLLITCPDRPGIVASVSAFLSDHQANITALDQHASAAENGQFFLRLEFQTPKLDVTESELREDFARKVATPCDMDWQMHFTTHRKRLAIFVSKHDHALLDLLWRWSRNEFDADIVAVISNHANLKSQVEPFGVPFHHFPIINGDKSAQESNILELLEDQVDAIALARYMQVLSPEFVAKFPNKIINIHHSFLPAFVGANPYRQAFEKGVKIIGATAHFVTADLDQGPIIEQDIAHVSHRCNVEELTRLGADVERMVFSRAVRWYLEDRIILDGHRTIVFS